MAGMPCHIEGCSPFTRSSIWWKRKKKTPMEDTRCPGKELNLWPRGSAYIDPNTNPREEFCSEEIIGRSRTLELEYTFIFALKCINAVGVQTLHYSLPLFEVGGR
jgi:hypothetical protein